MCVSPCTWDVLLSRYLNISCSSVQRDYVLHSRQKAGQLENTSERGWMLGRALKKELCFQAEGGSTGAACCAQPVVFGKSSRSYWFCEFALPSSLGPLTCTCFYLYFSACVIWVNVCETWILNFVGNRLVTLVLQDPFYITSKFAEIKRKWWSLFWGMCLRQHWKSFVFF